MAGVDLWLTDGRTGQLAIETGVVSGKVDLSSLADDTVIFDGGGLGRKLRVYRLPDKGASRNLSCSVPIAHPRGKDSPVWVRVTQEDGNQAWSSPIYLID